MEDGRLVSVDDEQVSGLGGYSPKVVLASPGAAEVRGALQGAHNPQSQSHEGQRDLEQAVGHPHLPRHSTQGPHRSGPMVGGIKDGPPTSSGPRLARRDQPSHPAHEHLLPPNLLHIGFKKVSVGPTHE